MIQTLIYNSDTYLLNYPLVVQGTSYENMTIIVRDYVLGLIQKYPYWNRTLGADHFFVACQDVGVRAFEGLEMMVKNSIRVVCSPSYNVGYVPHKDVALPQILQPFALPAGGNDIENRSGLILGQFLVSLFNLMSLVLDLSTQLTKITLLLSIKHSFHLPYACVSLNLFFIPSNVLEKEDISNLCLIFIPPFVNLNCGPNK